MRRVLVAWTPVCASLVCALAFFGASARAEAHLTVCNSGPRDIAIYEAYTTSKPEWETKSAVLVPKTKCVTFGDEPAPHETQFYLRVLDLIPAGSNTFNTAEETFNGPTKSFCVAAGQFSTKVAAYTIDSADSESTCTYYKAHVHYSGISIEWLRFFGHTLPRPTTRLNLE